MKNKIKKLTEIKNNLVNVNPYVFSTPSVSAKCIRMLVVIVIQIIMLAVTRSFSALYVILATTVGSVLAFVLHYIFVRRQLYTVYFSIIQGMLIGMLLPETYPIATAFFLSFFVVLISKYIFVNCVTTWVNIISVTVILAWFIGSRFFPQFLITRDLMALKNPSTYLIQNGVFPVYSFDSIITNFLNNTIFSWLKVTLPEGYISLLCDSHSVIPAFRFNLITIFSTVLFCSDDSFSVFIPAVFIGTYLLLVRLLFPMFAGGAFNSGDVILAMCSSGTLFITVFIFNWYGTHPATFWGKLIYAFISGIFAFFIVGCGTSPIGMVYTVLISNILNLIIRTIEENRYEAVCSLARARA